MELIDITSVEKTGIPSTTKTSQDRASAAKRFKRWMNKFTSDKEAIVVVKKKLRKRTIKRLEKINNCVVQRHAHNIAGSLNGFQCQDPLNCIKAIIQMTKHNSKTIAKIATGSCELPHWFNSLCDSKYT